MIIDHIKPHYEVRLKDTDPDTGEVFRDTPVAMTTREEFAEMITHALNRWSYEPNREFYILPRNKMTV